MLKKLSTLTTLKHLGLEIASKNDTYYIDLSRESVRVYDSSPQQEAKDRPILGIQIDGDLLISGEILQEKLHGRIQNRLIKYDDAKKLLEWVSLFDDVKCEIIVDDQLISESTFTHTVFSELGVLPSNEVSIETLEEMLENLKKNLEKLRKKFADNTQSRKIENNEPEKS